REEVRDDSLLLGSADVGGNRLRVERGRIDVEAAARPDDLTDQEPDDQRQRGYHLEIHQRLDADAPDLLEIAHRCDAVHDGAEDHRRDHHLDELNETVAERLERLSGFGEEIAHRDADQDRNDHLNIEYRVPRTTAGHGGSPEAREPASIRAHRAPLPGSKSRTVFQGLASVPILKFAIACCTLLMRTSESKGH